MLKKSSFLYRLYIYLSIYANYIVAWITGQSRKILKNGQTQPKFGDEPPSGWVKMPG